MGGTPAQSPLSGRGMDANPLERMSADRDQARLATPEVDDILEIAQVEEKPDVAVQRALLEAMRRAAKKSAAGVTENKRRRHYGHAAQLVATCAALGSVYELSTSPEYW